MDGQKNKLALKLLVIPILMFGFAFLLVPLYDVLCEVTGLNGRSSSLTEASDEQFKVATERSIKVKFLSSVATGFPVNFYPKQSTIEMHPGQVVTVYYIAENRSDEVQYGQAIPSVAPESGASWLKKVECFCFNEQQFAARDRVEMPVQLVIDPEIDADIEELTLSYTFFPKKNVDKKTPENESVIRTHSDKGIKEYKRE